MKKIFAFAMAVAAVMGVQAQDAKTLYNEAKKLDDAFNKAKPTAAAPNKQIGAEDALGLLKAMEIYDQVIVLDNQPNEKGEVKPKYVKKIDESRKKHAAAGDFNQAAVALYNENKRFPEAYNAFMMSGYYTQEFLSVPDTLYAIDFYNAGNMAYGTDFEAAAKAYTAARAAHVNEVNAYIYDIGSRQQLALKDDSYAEKAKEDIHAISKEGIERFGITEDFLLSNYFQYYIDNEKFDEALAMIAEMQKQYPENANLYRLRGIISNANHKYADAIPAFVQMAELTDRYDYLTRAADDLNRIGKMVMGNLGTNAVAPDQKQEVLDIFNSALKVAQKAAKVVETNPEATSADKANAANLIEDINYSLENANKL